MHFSLACNPVSTPLLLKGENKRTHILQKGGIKFYRTPWTSTWQQYLPSGWWGVPNIPHSEKRCQKCHSDTMVDDHKPLPGAQLRGNHCHTWLIPRNKTWHTSEHGLVRSSQNSNHLSNYNQIPEVRYTLLWRKEAGIFTQRCRNPLPLVKFFHGTISIQSVSRDNHDHGTMG